MSDNEELFDLLRREDDPGDAPSATLRAAVFGETAGVLARRRRARSLRALAGVLVLGAAAFLAGRASAPTGTTAAPQPASEPELEVADDAPSLDLASSTPAQLKEAGDRHARNGDVASALVCYREFLAAAPGDALELNADDSWLLASLKMDLE